MMYWLLIIILAYIAFGFGSLCDKLVLIGKPKPKAYTFYVGISTLILIVFIPFIDFGFPDATGLTWIMLDALVRVLGLYSMYVALEKFDVSKVIATIGAIQPVFIFILTWIFFSIPIIPTIDIVAFILLLVGSFVIAIEKTAKKTRGYLKVTIFSSVMFSLDYIFAKKVFINQTFLPGLIWINIFIFLFVLVFLITKKSRREIFERKMVLNKKTGLSFLLAQISGGAGNFLQMFAISLAPVAFLATINSLRGVQYVFLFFVAMFFSIFYPKILKENLSKKIILQKTISIVLIIAGLTLLVVY